jgi:hypothetical protein
MASQLNEAKEVPGMLGFVGQELGADDDQRGRPVGKREQG